MSQTNLYVGNLSWNTTEEQLKQHFESYGAVKRARIVLDKETNRSRGFGFIEFQNDADAQAALALDGTDFDGRSLRVNLANRQGPSPRISAPQNQRPSSGNGRSRRPQLAEEE